MSFKNADVSTKEGVKETMQGFNLMALGLSIPLSLAFCYIGYTQGWFQNAGITTSRLRHFF